MWWYLVQTVCERCRRWDLSRQLKKLGIESMPPAELEEITEAVAKPLLAECRNSDEREFIVLLTHIAYGFAGRPDAEGREGVEGVIAAMEQDDEDTKTRTREAIHRLMERWRELYPDFLPRTSPPV